MATELTTLTTSCPNGNTNWTSTATTDWDADGCQDSMEDTDDDNDGVLDAFDDCPLGDLDGHLPA